MNWNDIFYYENGEIKWKVIPCNRVKIGSPAGCLKNTGEVMVKFNGKSHRVADIVWRMHGRAIPEFMVVFHVDMNKTNNSIENLDIRYKYTRRKLT